MRFLCLSHPSGWIGWILEPTNMIHLINWMNGARNGGQTSVKLSVLSLLEVLVSVLGVPRCTEGAPFRWWIPGQSLGGLHIRNVKNQSLEICKQLQWIQEVHLIHYYKLPDNMSTRKHWTCIWPFKWKILFFSQRGKSGSASDGVTYEVKGLFIKI